MESLALPSFVPNALFIFCAVVMLVFSLGVVLARNPVRATLLLILSFLPTALLYILLSASFAGILQVLVYAGAIMMLFTFVIMMINPTPGGGETPAPNPHELQVREGSLRSTLLCAGLTLLAGALILIPIYRAASALSADGLPETPLKEHFGELGSISELLFRNSFDNPLTVSFELISFLVLVGIVAALNFSRRKSREGAES